MQFTERGTELMQRSFALFTKMERDYSQLVGVTNYKAMKRALRSLATRDNPAPPSPLRRSSTTSGDSDVRKFIK